MRLIVIGLPGLRPGGGGGWAILPGEVNRFVQGSEGDGQQAGRSQTSSENALSVRRQGRV